MTPHTQCVFAWAWMLMGLLSGVVLGLGFHRAQVMGGCDSWRRQALKRRYRRADGGAIVHALRISFSYEA